MKMKMKIESELNNCTVDELFFELIRIIEMKEINKYFVENGKIYMEIGE